MSTDSVKYFTIVIFAKTTLNNEILYTVYVHAADIGYITLYMGVL